MVGYRQMVDEERKHRPELPRNGPIRDLSNLWKLTPNETNGGADKPTEADPSEKSVGNAYDVIERYMREGQQIASKLGDAYSELNLGDSAREMQARWFELSGELLANWFDMAGSATDKGLTPGSRQASTLRAPQVEYELECRRRARISARFSPGAQRFELSGGPSVCDDPDVPGIAWKAITTHESDSIVVRARIKRKQPPGCYSSNAVNAQTGEVLGRITIEVL